MKKLKFLSLLVLGMCLSIQVFARKNVVLKGSWNRVEKSITLNLPIQVWLEDNNKDITIQFFKNLGLVDVSIISFEGNVIYNTVIDAGESYIHLVTLNKELNSLDCQIFISNKDNQVQGLFSVNR